MKVAIIRSLHTLRLHATDNKVLSLYRNMGWSYLLTSLLLHGWAHLTLTCNRTKRDISRKSSLWLHLTGAHQLPVRNILPLPRRVPFYGKSMLHFHTSYLLQSYN